MLKRFDEIVLAGATKVAHRFQRLTGLTTYFIARIGVSIAILSVIIDIINYYRPLLAIKTSFLDLFCDGFLMLIMIGRAIVTQKAEESLGSNVKPIFLMPFLLESYIWRVLWWFILIQGLWIWFSVASRSLHPFLESVDRVGLALGILIFSYFIMVDPLPPGTSKVREWINSLMFTPQLAKQESQS